MYIIPVVKDYAIPVVCKSSLTQFSSVSNPTLVVNKYSDIISSKLIYIIVNVSKVTFYFLIRVR